MNDTWLRICGLGVEPVWHKAPSPTHSIVPFDVIEPPESYVHPSDPPPPPPTHTHTLFWSMW